MAVGSPQSRNATTGRFGGSPFESASGFLEQLKGGAIKRGPSGPQTPAGAIAAGATPDQAKMVGAGAQKQATLSESMRQLSAGTAPTQDAAAAQAATRAQSLQALGSLGSRVQQLVQGRTAAVAQQAIAPAFDVEKAKTQLGGDQAKADAAKALAEAYIKAPSEATLAALTEALGLSAEAAGGGGIGGYFQGGPEALTQAISTADLEKEVTLGQLDLSGAGVDPGASAAALGLTEDAFRNLTLPQLQQALTDLSSRQFSKIASLEAELIGASPARRSEIEAELQGLRGSVTAQAETQMRDIIAGVEQAQTIQWLGKPIALEALLKDDQISKDIILAVTNPEYLKSLKEDPGTAGLATWIEQNSAGLSDIALAMETQAGTLKQTSALVGGLGEPLFNALLPEHLKTGAISTAAEALAIQDFLKTDPIAQAYEAGGLALAKLSETGGPELAAALREALPAGFTAADVEQVLKDTDLVLNDPTLKGLVAGGADIKVLTKEQRGQLQAIQAGPAWNDSIIKAWVDQNPGSRGHWLTATKAQVDAGRRYAQQFTDDPALGAMVGHAPGTPLAGSGQATQAENLKRRFPGVTKLLADPSVKALATSNPQALADLGRNLLQNKLKPSEAGEILGWYGRAGGDELFKTMLGEYAQRVEPGKTWMGVARQRIKAWDAIPRDIKADGTFAELLRSGVISGAAELTAVSDPDAWARIKGDVQRAQDNAAKLRKATRKGSVSQQFMTAFQTAFGSDLDLDALVRMGDQLDNLSAHKSSLTPKKYKELKQQRAELKEIFGFVPTTGDFAKGLSDRARKFLDGLIGRLSSPETIMDAALDPENIKDRGVLSNVADFLSGAKKFFIPGAAEARVEKPLSEIFEAPPPPVKAREPEELTQNQQWLKDLRENPTRTLSDLPMELAIRAIQELERGGFEEGVLGPAREFIFRSAPINMIPEHWKQLAAKPADKLVTAVAEKLAGIGHTPTISAPGGSPKLKS